MKTFRQYITEVTAVSLEKKGGTFTRIHLTNAGKPVRGDERSTVLGKKVSKIGKDHDVYRKRGVEGAGHEYNVVHRKTGQVHVTVAGAIHKHPGKTTSAFEVDNLAAHKKSTVPAHVVYHHLLKKHHSHLVSSDQQSEGGRKTWLKLAHKKGVKTHAWKPHPRKYELKHGHPWNVDIKKKGTTLTHRSKAEISQEKKHPARESDWHGKQNVRVVAHRNQNEETKLLKFKNFITESVASARPPSVRASPTMGAPGRTSHIIFRSGYQNGVGEINKHNGKYYHARFGGRGKKPVVSTKMHKSAEDALKHFGDTHGYHGPNLETQPVHEAFITEELK